MKIKIQFVRYLLFIMSMIVSIYFLFFYAKMTFYCREADFDGFTGIVYVFFLPFLILLLLSNLITFIIGITHKNKGTLFGLLFITNFLSLYLFLSVPDLSAINFNGWIYQSKTKSSNIKKIKDNQEINFRSHPWQSQTTGA